jgi:DNA-binding transcriptional LysR family regulator
MNIKLLKDALALIECGNLSKAAERRNVTQPAFSRRIRGLEDWVGAPLLKRGKNQVELTRELLEAEPEIRTIIARAEKLRQRLASREGHALPVVLATQHALAADVFPSTFASLTDRRPEISWRLRTLNREDCVSLFVRGDADLLLCYEASGFPPLPFDTTVERRVLGHDTLIPVVGGPLRYRMDADQKFAERVPVLSYPADSHFGRLLAQTGLSDAFPRNAQDGREVESAFSVVLLELVGRGAGVSWIPYTMCRAGLASGNLLSLAPSHGSISLEITLFAFDSNRVAMGIVDEL